MVGLVSWTLDTLDANWSTSNYPGSTYSGGKPEFINQDDADARSTSDRDTVWDLADNNAIGVGSQPSTNQTPMGTGYDYRVEAGVSVRIEGVHEDEWGHLSGSDEFAALVSEARRALHVERVWPIRNPGGDVHYHTLEIETENNNSPSHADYYRYDFDVTFRGFEDLP